MSISIEKILRPDSGKLPDPPGGKKDRLPPPKVRKAIKLIQDGTARTITAAAEQVGLSRPYLSETLHLPHVQRFIHRQNSTALTVAFLRSGPRASELVDAESEHVSMAAVEFVQGVNGVHAHDPRGPLVSLSLNVPGYIIDLSGNRVADDAARPAPSPGSPNMMIEGVANRDDHAARTIRDGRPVPLPRLGENELERQRQNELRALWVEDECRALSAESNPSKDATRE
jgi:hypothetical protein